MHNARRLGECLCCLKLFKVELFHLLASKRKLALLPSGVNLGAEAVCQAILPDALNTSGAPSMHTVSWAALAYNAHAASLHTKSERSSCLAFKAHR